MLLRQKIRTIVLSPLIFPHLCIYMLMGGGKIEKDLQRYNKVTQANIKNRIWAFLYIFATCPTFRNVFYYRIRYWRFLVGYMRGIPTCQISTKEIGGGLFIEHGGATYIAAKSIGENFYINQCATVGYSDNIHHPVIGNNVSVKAGAKVFGDVRIGNNVTVGANAVVVKNVPDNCTAVGVPAYIVRRDGKRTKENL